MCVNPFFFHAKFLPYKLILRENLRVTDLYVMTVSCKGPLGCLLLGKFTISVDSNEAVKTCGNLFIEGSSERDTDRRV